MDPRTGLPDHKNKPDCEGYILDCYEYIFLYNWWFLGLNECVASKWIVVLENRLRAIVEGKVTVTVK